MTPDEIRAREIRDLKETIENLREEIRQRDAAFGPAGQFPYELDLTHAEDVTLGILYNRHPAAVTLHDVLLRLFGAGGDVEDGRAGTLVRRIKAKVAARGIEIEIRPQGIYRLSDAGFEALKVLRERAAKRGQAGGLRIERRPFSEQEDAALTELWIKGNFLEDISVRLHAMGFPKRHMGTVSTRAKRLKLPQRTPEVWLPEHDEIVRSGYKAHHKFSRIKAALARSGTNRTMAAIKKRIEVLRIPPNRLRAMSPRELEIVNDGFARGIPNTQIVQALAREGYVRGVQMICRRRREKLGQVKRSPPGYRPIRGWRPPGAEAPLAAAE